MFLLFDKISTNTIRVMAAQTAPGARRRGKCCLSAQGICNHEFLFDYTTCTAFSHSTRELNRAKRQA